MDSANSGFLLFSLFSASEKLIDDNLFLSSVSVNTLRMLALKIERMFGSMVNWSKYMPFAIPGSFTTYVQIKRQLFFKVLRIRKTGSYWRESYGTKFLTQKLLPAQWTRNLKPGLNSFDKRRMEVSNISLSWGWASHKTLQKSPPGKIDWNKSKLAPTFDHANGPLAHCRSSCLAVLVAAYPRFKCKPENFHVGEMFNQRHPNNGDTFNATNFFESSSAFVVNLMECLSLFDYKW